MKPKVIKTEADHKAALARIDAIFDAKPGTPEGEELDLLGTLVELYEQKAYPLDMPIGAGTLRTMFGINRN